MPDGRRARGLRRVTLTRGLGWLAVIWAAFSLGAVSASGAVGHGFVGSLSEAPVGTGLRGPDAVAVDGVSGSVFVADPGSGMVDVYGASGAYETQFGGGMLSPVALAVDEASGLVYVADSLQDAVLVFRSDGAGGYELDAKWFGEGLPGMEFGQVMGVAVDNSASASAGDVYVVDGDARGIVGGEDVELGVGVVDVFKPQASGPEEGGEGALVRQLTAGGLESPNGVAVSASSGMVLVADSVKGAIYTYNATGAPEGKLTGKGSPYGAFAKTAPVGDVAGVAVDAASGDVYVAEAERHVVSQYSASGEWEGWIAGTPAGSLGEPRGVALNGAGEVFVADTTARLVDRFGAGTVVPSVETGKVAKAALTRTTAVLAGTIDGEGKAAQYRFQYGESTALGSETGALGSGAGLEAVSATVEKLHAGTTYYYRIVGEDEDGVDYGEIRELETPRAVVSLETGVVENVVPERATLTGSLKRESLETHYHFQYGASEAYGSTSMVGEVPAGSSEKEEKQPRILETAISGLRPNTLYHYRLVAENPYGTTYGQDRTFTTSGPPRIVYEPVSGVGQEEATVHAQIDPDQLASSYRVQYGETSSYGSEAPGGEGIAPGSGFVAVSITLPGLAVGATYHFRVVAENEAGISYGEDQTFTTVAAAAVDASYAAEVGSSEATLHTRIDPLGHDTHYYFQYGTQDCQTNPGACTDTPAPPGEDIGEGTADIAGEAKLSGLSPDTTYRYRVLASNSLGVSMGPERTFTTQAATSALALADNRAWEMVSPPNKQGAPVEALPREGGLILAAEDGDSLTYVVDGALEEDIQGNRSPEWQQVLATRKRGRWVSRDIANPNTKAKGYNPGLTPEYQYFTPNLSAALVQPAPAGVDAEPPLAPGVTQATMYVRDTATGAFLPLITEANVAPGTVFGGEMEFVDATPDLDHVVIASKVALTGPSSAPGLYEWSAGALQPVSVLPNGRPARGLVELGYANVKANAISSDGALIIWTAPEDERAGRLFVRDTATGETLRLDVAQGTSEPAGVAAAHFQVASSDASRVFFTDVRKLTPHATAETSSNEPDLYECEIVQEAGRLACHLHDVTGVENAGEHAGVQGLPLGASEDGSYLYLVAHGVLATNRNASGEYAVDGEDNLYELHFEGASWTTTFIARFSGEDSPEWAGNEIANPAYVTARVSPDGRYLAFMSSASLTGYDNVDASPGANGARDEEVYLYDSQTASLRCVSCDPSGARPAGVLDTFEGGEGVGLLVDRRQVWRGHWIAGSIPGWTAENLTSALIQPRYLSDDGRLFFDSPSDLVAAATNHKEDVYEYEPAGLGSCESATGGCVALLSSGSPSKESAFIEATPDGSDVFFVTAAQLLPQDTDTAFDIYDARACTASSPCLTPTAGEAPGCAETETCRPAEPAKQIPAGPAGTETSSGPGNIIAAKKAPAKQQVEARKAEKPLTRAQKLVRALAGCRRRYAHSKRRRAACERKARKRYGKRHAKAKLRGKAETARPRGRS